MTQWNAVDRERSGRGPSCIKLVAVLFSAEREHSSLSDAQDGSTYVPKPIRQRVYWKKSRNEKAQTFHEHRCSFPGRTTMKEPQHLEHGARNPRESRERRSGSDSKGVCRPMGSLSKRSPRRWSFEELIPVCLSVARRAYASAPKREKKYRSTADLGACAGSSRRCAVQHAGRARSKQV